MRADYARRYRTLWERHWWWRSREAMLLGRIDRLHRRSARRPIRILDVGCGDGLFFERLERFGRVEGLEPDATLVHDPRWRSRISNEPLGEGFRPADEYDLVLMLDVLEHIGDDLGALRTARSALRPGGALVLTVPALRWLWSRHDEANQHFRRYYRAGLHRLLDGAGFEVEDVRFFFCWTVGPMRVRRWLTPANGGEGSADYDVLIPHPALNWALGWLSRVEHAVGRVVRWPLGSSLLAIARRPAVTDSPVGFRGRAVALGLDPGTMVGPRRPER